MSTVQAEQDRTQVALTGTLDLGELAAKVASLIVPSAMPQEEEGFIGTSEALAFLGWGEGGYSRLLRRCRANTIPHYRETRQIYFRKSELSDWLADREGRA